MILLVALVGNAIVALWILAPQPKSKLSAQRAALVVDALDNSAGSGAAVGLNGRWTLRGDAASTVGYRIDEQAIGGVATRTAVGRTNTVTAEVTIAGKRLQSAKLVADLRELASDQVLRDNMIRSRGLEIDTYPTAVFESTATPDLAPLDSTDAVVQIELSGQIRLHGVTKAVTAHVLAQRRRNTIVVTGTINLTLSDFKIDKPNVANIVSIADHGVVEWQLFLSNTSSTTASVSTSSTTIHPTLTPLSIISSAQSSIGPILVDGDGHTLYLLGGDTPTSSTCDSDCAQAWPPLSGPAKLAANSSLDTALLGTITRADGSLQATYRGSPLYRTTDDKRPGDVSGQGAMDVWFAISPNGQPNLTKPPTG